MRALRRCWSSCGIKTLSFSNDDHSSPVTLIRPSTSPRAAMYKYICPLVVITALSFMCTSAQPVNAEILEPPRDQYVLEGSNATIICTVHGQTALWVINGTVIHSSIEQSLYEGKGVIFTNTTSDMTHNLTMVVPAYLSGVVRNVMCVARDASHRQRQSDPVTIFVLQTFRPNPPIVSVDPIYHPFMLPQLTATIAGQLLWRGYDISEFNVDITNGSDDSLLYHLTVPNNSSGNNTATVNINQTMLESTAEQCYSLKVYTSAVSRLYGLSEPTLVETAVFRVPGALSDQSINLTTLFNPDGTLSHVNVKMQLPEVCIYQPINYTITIEDVSVGEVTESRTSGPHSHVGAGVVSQDIIGLQKDHTYTVKVQVDSVTGSVESNKQLFNTEANFDSCANPTSTSTHAQSAIDTTIYVAAMSIAIGAAVVVLIAFGISLVCLCAKRQRTKVYGPGDNSRNGTTTSMVTNPIYAGPVYDMIDPRFESLSKPSSPQLSIPVSPMSPLSDDSMGHDECSHLTSVKSKPTLRNVYTLPGDLRSPAAQKLALKKNGLERNKRHLTLPLEGKSNSHCQRSEMNEEETYVEMSTKGTVTPLPN